MTKFFKTVTNDIKGVSYYTKHMGTNEATIKDNKIRQIEYFQELVKSNSNKKRRNKY